MLRIAALFAIPLLLAACHNDCSFESRCDGGALEICGDGPDQVVNRKIESTPCLAPNPVCVQVTDSRGATEASCAQSDAACDPHAPATCQGTDLLLCDGTVKAPVVHPCSDGGPCQLFDGGARCTGS